MISVYIHIPFCLQKCLYCDFLSGPGTDALRGRYVRALIDEITYQEDCPSGTLVDTVFFGGGTPSVLDAPQIAGIMEALRRRFRVCGDAEISLEMNPGTADLEKLCALREAGFNRLSIGVQSMHDEELRTLGRIHTSDRAKETYRQAREAGFENINLDLMSALPGQTFESWADSLQQAVSWGPEHISAYSLIIEPGTPFARMHEAGTLPPLPDEDTERRMYHFTKEYLAEHGYTRYEISNYAKPGRECRHNSGYWTGHPYLGFGTGAASCTGGTRFSNVTDADEYIRAMEKRDVGSIRTDLHHLTKQEQMEEFMFLGLRMTAGVREADFLSRFGRSLESVYGDVLRKQTAQGVLEQTAEGYLLTERGIDVSNYVLADYLF